MIDRSRQIITPAIYLTALLLLASLGRFAIAGLASRYWADDYCYSSVFAAGGLLRGPIDWFMLSGNRFATIYLVGLQDLFGPGAIRFVPGAVLLTLALGWLVFLRAAARAAGVKAGFFAVFLLALTQVFFLVLLAPDRLQTLYWRMGTLHYTFPLALLLLNLAVSLDSLARFEPSYPARFGRALGAFALAFFAAGFSETFAALQAGVFILGFAVAAAILFGTQAGVRRAAASTLPALLGGLAAMGLMLFSPSNAWRQAALPPPENLGEFLAYTLRYTFDFAADTLRGAPLPLIFLALLSASGAYLGFARVETRPYSLRAVLAAVAGCLLGGLALSACAIAPSVYAGLQFPAGRALMPARFALLLGLAGASMCLGAAARRSLGNTSFARSPIRGVSLAGLFFFLALFAGSFYLARHLTQPLPEQAALTAWAARWDERDAAIRVLRAGGETGLLLPQVEVVRGLEDIGPDPNHWVNRCAAAYYRVKSIQTFP